MVCGFAVFKHYVSLIFFKGSLMRDKHQLFNMQTGAKQMRTIRINHIDQMDEARFKDY
jgi:hypothetical protein